MGGWIDFNLVDPMTQNTANLALYHDLVLVVIASVMLLVGWFLGIFLCQGTFFKGRWDFSIKENQSLEMAWTVSPSFILFGLGFVSLYNLYMMEVGSGVCHSVEAHGNQWFWVYNYSVNMQMISDGFLEDLKRCCANFFLTYHKQFSVGLWPILNYYDSSYWPDYEPVSFEDSILIGFLRLSLGGFWSSSVESYGVPADMLKQEVGMAGGFPNRDVTSACLLAFGVKNEVKVSTSDVMHSWGVPELGVKVDAVPGRVNSLGIIPFMPGFAYGFCYELCGVGHSSMPIVCFITSQLNVENFLSVQVFNSAEIWDREGRSFRFRSLSLIVESKLF